MAFALPCCPRGTQVRLPCAAGRPQDLADLLVLLSAEGETIHWGRVIERIPKKDAELVLRTALADYRTTSKLYPLSMDEYRRLKGRVARAGLQ